MYTSRQTPTERHAMEAPSTSNTSFSSSAYSLQLLPVHFISKRRRVGADQQHPHQRSWNTSRSPALALPTSQTGHLYLSIGHCSPPKTFRWESFERVHDRVSSSLPHPENDKYARCWPGAWQVGNVARSGYPATTSGTWPYAYSCDVGTFPNHTYPTTSAPTSVVYSACSKYYNYALCWLLG